jgi:hypothetical protein
VHTKVKRSLLLLLTTASLAAAGLFVDPLQQMRARYDLTGEPVKGLSPKLALATQVLGWARGVIMDVIWIRMEGLKREGRYFELVQLADWACLLAPRIPDVWDFNSWNLAYNVSCQVDYLPDRWAWVESGIELLREDGIPLNPTAPELHSRLAFIIYHKIGQEDDYGHLHYKREFGRYMHAILSGQGTREVLQRAVDAPATREELLLNEEVRGLVDECSKYGFDIIEHYFAWFHGSRGVPAEVNRILATPRGAAALELVQDFVRARKLGEMSMSPAYMLELMESYGPLDWRSPFPHAIYWATMGLRELLAKEARLEQTLDEFMLPPIYVRQDRDWRHGDREELYDFRRVELERLIYGSLQNLVDRGRILFDTHGNMLMQWGTHYGFADACIRYYQRARDTWPGRYKKGVESAYRFFLEKTITHHSVSGSESGARKYFDLLRKEFPDDPAAAKGFESYVQWAVSDYLSSMSFADARNLVGDRLYAAFVYAAYGDYTKAHELETEARYVAEKFEREEGSDSLRTSVRYEKIREAVLVDILTGQVTVAPEAVENLKRELGQAEVERILALGKGRVLTAETVDASQDREPR